MATVYVWMPRTVRRGDENVKYYGHASLRVGSTYISWWPRQNVEHLECVGGYNGDFDHDVAQEQKQPEHSIRLPRLNEGAMRDWWARRTWYREYGNVRRESVEQWCTLGPNCCTLVYEALLRGGANRYVVRQSPPALPRTLLAFVQRLHGVLTSGSTPEGRFQTAHRRVMDVARPGRIF